MTGSDKERENRISLLGALIGFAKLYMSAPFDAFDAALMERRDGGGSRRPPFISRPGDRCAASDGRRPVYALS